MYVGRLPKVTLLHSKTSPADMNTMKNILNARLLLGVQGSLTMEEMPLFVNVSSLPTSSLTHADLNDLDVSNYSFPNKSGSPCDSVPINFLEEKKWITVIFGSIVAVLSIVLNFLLLYMFVSRKRLRYRNFYTMALSVCDIAMAILFLFAMDVLVVAVWMQNIAAYRIWQKYIIPAFALGNVVMTVSTFLIVAASIDRYIATMDHVRNKLISFRSHKGHVILYCAIIGIILRGTIVFEIHFEKNPMCADGFQREILTIKKWARHSLYASLWRFYIRHVVGLFLPFVLLVYFNYVIVAKLKRDQIQGSFSLHPRSAYMRIKEQTRSATKMLVLIVSSYLIVNSLNLVVTAWEHIDSHSLHAHSKFYELATDIVSVLSIASGAIRLPVYALVNKSIRRELKEIIIGLVTCTWFESSKAKMRRMKRYSLPPGSDSVEGAKFRIEEPDSVWLRRNAVSFGSYRLLNKRIALRVSVSDQEHLLQYFRNSMLGSRFEVK